MSSTGNKLRPVGSALLPNGLSFADGDACAFFIF